MTAVGAVPQVTKLAMSTSGTGIDLWVFMAEDDYEAEGLISLAERDFLNSGCPPIVLIHVVPGNDIDLNMLPPMTVLLERWAVADDATHRAEAVANRELAEYLLAARPNEPTALRWAVTATFYSALHALTAHLITQGVAVTSHHDRSLALANPANGVPLDVFKAYQFLKRRSMGSRYYLQTFAPWQVQRLLDVPLKIVFDSVGL
jgi:hypothetical protein